MAFGKAQPRGYVPQQTKQSLRHAPMDSGRMSPGMQAVKLAGIQEEKSLFVAYFLWFFLGGVGGHRFYLGKWKSAILQFLSMFILVGLIWLIIDAVLMPKMVRNKNNGA